MCLHVSGCLWVEYLSSPPLAHWGEVMPGYRSILRLRATRIRMRRIADAGFEVPEDVDVESPIPPGLGESPKTQVGD